jgi:hypothetical protein
MYIYYIFFPRKLSKRTKNESKETADHFKDEQKSNSIENSNNNYFVLEPVDNHASVMKDAVSSESESPYNDLPEGEYDVLRDKNSRKKVVNDTYATSAGVNDYSDYDVTTRNKQTEEDSTYDHAGSNIASEYGYSSVQHQEEEDAYSKTEY